MKKIPKWWANSLKDVDIAILKEEGKKYLLLDLDNTITKPFNKVPNKEEISLLSSLKSQFQIYIISNNKEKRVQEFCADLGIKYLARAGKPFLKRTKDFLKEENINLNEVVFIGDQIFTDIHFASRLNIESILVEPITKDEQFFIKIKRIFEKLYKNNYKKKKIVKEMGNINVK